MPSILETHKVELGALQRRESWDNVWLWPRKYQMAIGGTLFHGALFSLNNAWYKRPWYAYARRNLMWSAIWGGVCFAGGLYHAAHYKARDAVLEHYISLHPNDFQHISFDHMRTFGDVLMPWTPVRAHEYLPSKLVKSKLLKNEESKEDV